MTEKLPNLIKTLNLQIKDVSEPQKDKHKEKLHQGKS